MKYTKKEIDDAFEDYKLIIEEERQHNKNVLMVATDGARIHKQKQLRFARLREVTSN